MTTNALLILLNGQLLVVVVYCFLERHRAVTYRRETLDVQNAQLDADLATYARARGLKRRDELQDAGRQRNGRVLAASERQQPHSRNGATDVVAKHPTILLTGQDGA